MEIVANLLIFIIVALAVILICLILVQRSKQGGLGALGGGSAGGATEEVFGAGFGNVLSKATVVCVVLFFASTMGLTFVEGQRAKSKIDATTAPGERITPLPGGASRDGSGNTDGNRSPVTPAASNNDGSGNTAGNRSPVTPAASNTDGSGQKASNNSDAEAAPSPTGTTFTPAGDGTADPGPPDIVEEDQDKKE
ncbi:MAG: preprotein translocase subunit SecG [Lentisphaeria bacterium]|jgi:preprotein translocase subunit SecG|nr:preprotein translocase subunit SecG [Lentisphaeria bacterium]